MATVDGNFLTRSLRWLWGLIDGTRRLVLNLIFLFLVLLFVVALVGPTAPELKSHTALVVSPVGVIVENYTQEPFDRALSQWADTDNPETRLRDVLRAIELAADDPNISHLVISPDRIMSAGMGVLQDMAAAVARFRASGKPVTALSDGMNQQQYYLAASADRIILHPEGMVFLEGFGRYRNYYKTLLDSLGVDVHVFRVGEYKSAAEPFVRDDMSPATREANLSWLTSLWDSYLSEVGGRRGLSAPELHETVESFGQRLKEHGGQTSLVALESGLVDVIANSDEAIEYLVDNGVARVEGGYRQVGVDEYLARAAPRLAALSTKNKVAVIVAQGAITSGQPGPESTSGQLTVGLLKQARHDSRVRAVVLRVNSPGGQLFPSEQIRREVEITRASGKPVVVSMGDVAASGGYWIAMSANEIWANASTITGSIGVFGLVTTIPRGLDKIGVHTDGVGTTAMAGALRIDRPLDNSVGELIQQIVENGYSTFISKVAEFRGMSIADVDEVARGRVWSGAQAQTLGLIDQLGGLSEATQAAAALAGETDYQVRYLEPEMSATERFLLDLSASQWLPRWSGSWFAKLDALKGTWGSSISRDLQLLNQGSSGKPAVYAYCFCSW